MAGTLFGILLLGASPSGAQPVVPLGDQFQVNSLTPGYQWEAKVAHGNNDIFVVVWESNDFPDISRVRRRRFTSQGSPIGPGGPLNPDATSAQFSAEVVWTLDDRYLVVWTEAEQSGRRIRGRRYNDTMDPDGLEFEISPATEYPREPSLSQAATGEFVVAWSGQASESGIDYDILVRRFEYGGAPIGDAVQANTFDPGRQTDPVVRFQPTGEFIVAWSSDGSLGDDSSGYSIQLRRFDTDGSPIGTEIQVNTYTTDSQKDPAVGVLSDGSFVVVWPDDEIGIRARRFDPQAEAVGAEFQVNTYTTGRQDYPSIAVAEGDEFVVTWHNQAGYDWRLGGRAYDAGGAPIGDEFRVDSLAPSSFLVAPWASFDSDSGFVVAWHGYGSAGSDSDGSTIQARRFELPAIFYDGFESGDLSAWSSNQP